MDQGFAVIGIGLAIFCFLLVLLGIGSFYGGDWNTVAQGIAKFILIIVGFAVGVFALIAIMGRR